MTSVQRMALFKVSERTVWRAICCSGFAFPSNELLERVCVDLWIILVVAAVMWKSGRNVFNVSDSHRICDHMILRLYYECKSGLQSLMNIRCAQPTYSSKETLQPWFRGEAHLVHDTNNFGGDQALYNAFKVPNILRRQGIEVDVLNCLVQWDLDFLKTDIGQSKKRKTAFACETHMVGRSLYPDSSLCTCSAFGGMIRFRCCIISSHSYSDANPGRVERSIALSCGMHASLPGEKHLEEHPWKPCRGSFGVDLSVLFLEPCIPRWLDVASQHVFADESGFPQRDHLETVLSDARKCEQTAVSDVIDTIERHGRVRFLLMLTQERGSCSRSDFAIDPIVQGLCVDALVDCSICRCSIGLLEACLQCEECDFWVCSSCDTPVPSGFKRGHSFRRIRPI